MPLFKNLIAYRISPGWAAPDLARLDEALQQAAFRPCEPTEPLSIGWVPPRGEEHGAMVEAVDGHWLMRLVVERRAVPAGAVRAELEARCRAIEAAEGRKPGRKERGDLKEDIVHALLPRAFSKRASLLLWLDLRGGLLLVGASSARAAEPAVQALVDRLADLRHVLSLAPLQTATSPAIAMAHWLTTQEPPEGFAIDRDLELRDTGEARAVVRYARHHLALEEIGRHIAEGKLPARLAMTWQDRVSFVLTDTLCLQRIAFADVEDAPKGEDGFDADAAIATGEFTELWPGLLAALGGEAVPGQGPAASAAAPAGEGTDTPAASLAGLAPWEDDPGPGPALATMTG